MGLALIGLVIEYILFSGFVVDWSPESAPVSTDFRQHLISLMMTAFSISAGVFFVGLLTGRIIRRKVAAVALVLSLLPLAWLIYQRAGD